MIDIEKRNICDGCDKSYSKKNPHDIYNLFIGDKQIVLCEDCLKVLHDKIEEMANMVVNNRRTCNHEWFKYKDKETEWNYICCSKCGETIRICD